MAYKTLGMMRNGGMQKDINDYYYGGAGTTYLLSKDRKPYLVTVNAQKRLVQGDPTTFLINTKDGSGGQYIFVMDGDGNIYSASKKVVHHHSSFLAGGPVAAAGHWTIEYGALKAICNDSGHYQPPFDYTQQVLAELKKRGVDVSGVVATWTGASSAQLAVAYKARNIAPQRLGPKGVVASAF